MWTEPGNLPEAPGESCLTVGKGGGGDALAVDVLTTKEAKEMDDAVEGIGGGNLGVGKGGGGAALAVGVLTTKEAKEMDDAVKGVMKDVGIRGGGIVVGGVTGGRASVGGIGGGKGGVLQLDILVEKDDSAAAVGKGGGAPIHNGSDGSGRWIGIADKGKNAAEVVVKKEGAVVDSLGGFGGKENLAGGYNASEADGGAAAGLVDESRGESKGRAFEQDGLELVGNEVGARMEAVVSLRYIHDLYVTLDVFSPFPLTLIIQTTSIIQQ